MYKTSLLIFGIATGLNILSLMFNIKFGEKRKWIYGINMFCIGVCLLSTLTIVYKG